MNYQYLNEAFKSAGYYTDMVRFTTRKVTNYQKTRYKSNIIVGMKKPPKNINIQMQK